MSTGHTRPYITAKFRKTVLTSLHGLGHPSHRATKPLMNTCKGCQTAKISCHNKPVFGKFTEPNDFDHVHIDLIGPLPYSDDFKYLLTVDRFTEAIPLVDIRAETVADAFFSGWIARLGPQPLSPWIEAPSSNKNCGIICAINSG